MILILELKGKRVFLKKLENLEGKHSRVPVDKVQEINLTENVTTGYTLMKKRVSKHRDEAPMSVPATSAVTEVLDSDDATGVHRVRTSNSIYEIKVIS